MLPSAQLHSFLRRRDRSVGHIPRRGIDTQVMVFSVVVSCVLALCPLGMAGGDLKEKEARKLISRMAGIELKTGAVRVGKISSVDSATVETSAEIEAAFRLERNDRDQWRVAEIRTGRDRWEALEYIANALNSELNAGSCDLPELAARVTTTDPSNKRARCLIANLLNVKLPSDDVRIKDISPLALPLSSHASALVEAVIRADVRFTKDQHGAWRVNGVKTGNRDWFDPDALLSAVDMVKTMKARADLQLVARALEAFRAKRGFYVESKSEAVLIDFLSPVYLSRVIRLDPWRRPYRYEGTRDHFTLLSVGPDGKENTSDDILLSGPARTVG
jgi:Type II secretion system (T2SS), protein G